MKENKRKAVLMVVVLFFGLCIGPSIIGIDKTVSPLNNILYVGGSGQGNYTSIQDAIDDANNGDTVFVYSGIYYENVKIYKSIILEGSDEEYTVIDGSKLGDTVKITADNVNINKFTITNGAEDIEYHSGLKVLSDGNVIKNNKISGNEGKGIRLISSSNNVIEENEFINNNFINLVLNDECNYNEIKKNYFTRTTNVHPDGISLYSNSNHNIIEDNEITNLTYCTGIKLDRESDNNIIAKNLIHNNKYHDGIDIQISKGSKNNKVISNTLRNNAANGLSIAFSDDNEVISNTIESIGGTGLGIHFSSNNIIYQNNFIENGGNAFDNYINIWDNGKKGNFWDDYTGIDADGDGIGDTPYDIPGGSSQDRYPLMEPWNITNVNITLNGTMGENDWYVSDVTITFVGDCAYIQYEINNGGWQDYTSPFMVTVDGEHTLCWYYVDNEGNQSEVECMEFKIDQTKPTIELTVEKMGSKWLFYAYVSDETSGIAKVEFYVDDEFVGEVTELPYEWEWSGTGNGHVAQAIVYDNAGNSAQDEKPVSHSQSQKVHRCFQYLEDSRQDLFKLNFT